MPYFPDSDALERSMTQSTLASYTTALKIVAVCFATAFVGYTSHLSQVGVQQVKDLGWLPGLRGSGAK